MQGARHMPRGVKIWLLFRTRAEIGDMPIYLNLSRLTIPNVPECSSQNPNPTPNLTPFENKIVLQREQYQYLVVIMQLFGKRSSGL